MSLPFSIIGGLCKTDIQQTAKRIPLKLQIAFLTKQKKVIKPSILFLKSSMILKYNGGVKSSLPEINKHKEIIEDALKRNIGFHQHEILKN